MPIRKSILVKTRNAMNRRLYNNQSFVETAIYRVFVMIYRILAIYNSHQKTLTKPYSYIIRL